MDYKIVVYVLNYSYPDFGSCDLVVRAPFWGVTETTGWLAKRDWSSRVTKDLPVDHNWLPLSQDNSIGEDIFIIDSFGSIFRVS